MTRSITRLFPGEDSLRGRLIRGGASSAAAHALNRALALASGILLARALSASGYGTYAYAFAVMNVLTIVAEAGMPTMVMRDVAKASQARQWAQVRGFITRGRQIVIILSLPVSVAGLLVVVATADLDLSAPVSATMIAMFVLLPVVALFRTTSGAIKGLHKVGVAQLLELITQPALFLACAVLVFALFPAHRTPQHAMVLQVVSFALVLLVSLVVVRSALPAGARSVQQSLPDFGWMRGALPFALIGGAMLINNQADVLMLGFFRSAEEVGVYSVAAQSAVLVGFLLQAATAVVAPHFASLHAAGDVRRLWMLVNRIAMLVTLGSLPIVVVFAFAGAEILGFVFGDEFRAGGLVLLILATGYLVNGAFGPVGALLQMTGNERATARMLWYTAGLNILLNAVVIPYYGAVGAASSTALTISLYHYLLRRVAVANLGAL